MAEVLRCDGCEAVGTLYEYPWRKVEYVAEITEYKTDPRDKHFCTMACLMHFAVSECNETLSG